MVDFSVVVAATVRTIYQGLALSGGIDVSWMSYAVYAAGIAESNLAIICACAPSLKFVLSNFFRDYSTTPGIRGSRYGSSGSSGAELSKRSQRGWNPIVFVERSVDVDSVHGESSEPSYGVHQNFDHGNEKTFGRSITGATASTTETSVNGAVGTLPQLENSWGSNNGKSFMFFTDNDEEEMELTQIPRRTHGVL
jgi:hypothetical protein